MRLRAILWLAVSNLVLWGMFALVLSRLTFRPPELGIALVLGALGIVGGASFFALIDVLLGHFYSWYWYGLLSLSLALIYFGVPLVAARIGIAVPNWIILVLTMLTVYAMYYRNRSG